MLGKVLGTSVRESIKGASVREGVSGPRYGAADVGGQVCLGATHECVSINKLPLSEGHVSTLIVNHLFSLPSTAASGTLLYILCITFSTNN